MLRLRSFIEREEVTTELHLSMPLLLGAQSEELAVELETRRVRRQLSLKIKSRCILTEYLKSSPFSPSVVKELEFWVDYLFDFNAHCLKECSDDLVFIEFNRNVRLGRLKPCSFLLLAASCCSLSLSSLMLESTEQSD